MRVDQGWEVAVVPKSDKADDDDESDSSVHEEMCVEMITYGDVWKDHVCHSVDSQR